MNILEENKKHLGERWDKKHIITIFDNATGRTMTSVGEYYTGSRATDGSCVTAYYRFKTADNESGIKVVKYENGNYTIELMMRNKPVPSNYTVIEYRTEEKYTPEEKECLALRQKIHEYLKYQCGMFNEYKHYNGVPLEFKSIGKTIIVEYFTPDWFGIDDIINYQTDHVRMSSLDKNDLELVLRKLL